MHYIAPLDGIRAVAIIAVIIFHISKAPLRGGFTGVDVFFVLSGFLITSNILHHLREGQFSLREFYLRRIQRLMPNVLAMLLATLALWAALLPPSMAQQTARHGLYALLNLSNFYIWRKLGHYWGDLAESSPLTHTWSLAIEEQFYLLFPFVLLLLARFQTRRTGYWLFAATALSFTACLYGSYAKPASRFYLLPTRVWELLLGSVLASHMAPAGQAAGAMGSRRLEAVGWAGLFMIFAGFFVIDEQQPFPGLAALLPTVGTMLLIQSVAAAEGGLARMLSTRFMVGTGKLSYALYLWHWPLITIGKIQAELYGLPPLAGAILGGLAGLLLGWVSYVMVEQPLRRRGPGRTRRLAVISAGFVATALASTFVGTRPVVADPNHRFERPAFYGAYYSAGQKVEVITSSVGYNDVYFPPIPPSSQDSWRTGGVVRQYGDGPPRVVVFGSSHALMYGRLIDEICKELGVAVAFLCMDWGTPAFFETKPNANFSAPEQAGEYDETRKKWLREWQPDMVFVIDRWEHFVSTPELFEEKLRSFLAEVSPNVGQVGFVSQVPVVRYGDKFNLRELVNWYLDKQMSPPRLFPDSNEPLRRASLATALKLQGDFPKLKVLRADLGFYQDDGSVRYASGRSFYYVDDDHLSEQGAQTLREPFRKAIVEATSK